MKHIKKIDLNEEAKNTDDIFDEKGYQYIESESGDSGGSRILVQGGDSPFLSILQNGPGGDRIAVGKEQAKKLVELIQKFIDM